MDSKIRKLELYVYFSVWITANIFSLYKLIESQNDIFKQDYRLHNSLPDLRPGWRYFSRLKDVSDEEWSTWKYFFHTSWFYLLINITISEIIRSTKVFLLKYWYILSTIIFVILYMGVKQLMLITFQPILFAAIILCGGRKIVVWIASIGLLLALNSLKYHYFFWDYLEYDNMHDEEVNLLVFSLAWVELRCISFCIDYIELKEKATYSKHSETILDMFSYVFYLPLLYTGPVILYEDFKRSFHVKNQKLAERLKYFTIDMCIFQFYTLVMDFALHYIYFSAMQSDMVSLRKMTSYGLCGGGLWMGLQFHLKYVIAYGTTCAFARLDHMEAPPIPRCIARVHVYSQMWRHFDVGLYKFLVKYTYKPASKIISKFNMNKMATKSLATLTTFAFILLWHGTVWDIFVWSAMNFFGIMLEHSGKAMSETKAYKNFKTIFLQTDSMETRFIALLCTPLLMLSAMSNFYLFAGSEVGNWYFECFFHPSLINAAIVCISLYSCCHVSMAISSLPSRTEYSNKTK